MGEVGDLVVALNENFCYVGKVIVAVVGVIVVVIIVVVVVLVAVVVYSAN